MTPQELKNSILQLAIQGKLVEQRPEEGTAEELYQQIQIVKQRLIREGKIKKEKPLPEITEEEKPFDIPDGWKWVRLGDYSQKITDQVASGSFASLRANVPSLKEPDYAIMVKTADFSNGFTRNLTYTDRHGYEFLENSNLFGGELILSNIGSIGKCFIVPKLEKKMTLAPNSVMVRLIFDEQRDYLYQFILSPQGYQELVGITSGTAMKKFNKTDLKQILVPVPPLAEQKRIVAKIEELQPLIDRYEKAWTRLEEFNKQFPGDLQKSILQMAIQGKLVEQWPEEETGEDLYQQIQAEKQKLIREGKIKKEKPLPEITEEEKPFDIPENWIWARMDNITLSILAGKSKRCNETPPQNDEIGIVKVSAVTWGSFQENESKTCISMNDWVDDYRIHKNDFLISRANTKKLVGACVIVEQIQKRLMLSDKILRISFSNSIDLSYILYIMRSGFLRGQIELVATGTSDSMKNISQNNILNLVIPLPPLAEQKRIVKKIEELLPLCQKLQ